MSEPTKPCIVVGATMPIEVMARLESHFNLVSRDQIAHAVGTLGVVPDRALLDEAKELRCMSAITAGYDNYDVDALNERRIALTTCPNALTETVADLAFLLVLATARKASTLSRLMADGNWTQAIGYDLYGLDVYGRTLGIVGMGRIGQAVARRGELGFGMPVLYTSRSPKANASGRRVEMDELLTKSDFVVVCVPLTRETDRLIGARELALMQPTAILVNIARGRVLDEAALIEALRANQIAGAGLDVYEQEPLPVSSPLHSLQNVVLLPHIGSATKRTRDAMAAESADNLIAFLVHGDAKGVVNPEALR